MISLFSLIYKRLSCLLSSDKDVSDVGVSIDETSSENQKEEEFQEEEFQEEEFQEEEFQEEEREQISLDVLEPVEIYIQPTEEVVG
jgi:hypothetical protein